MTKKLNILFIAAMVTAVLVGVCFAEQDVVTRINSCFENGQFTEGLNMLQKELSEISKGQRPNIEDERTKLRPALLLMKARFYEDYAGNLLQAKRFYRQVLQLKPPAEQKYLVDAGAGIKRIEDYDRKYAREIKLFTKIKKQTGRGAELEKVSAQLLKLISNNSDELLLASAYYYLGNVYLDRGMYWPAYKMSLKVVELKPAFHYYLPVNTLKYDAYKQWLLNLIVNIVWFMLLALLIFIAAIFYFSRPWRWLNIRVVTSAIIIILLFAVFGLLIMWLINKTATPPPDYMSPPMYYRADFGGFNSWLPSKYLLYILTASVGAIILVTSTLRFKHCWTWRLINVLAAILLFSGIFTVFFLRYGFDSSSYSANSFYREKDSVFSYFSGRTYFRLRDVRPFVLTNPTAYPDLGTKKVDEPVFAEWFEKIAKNAKTLDESTESQK
ncbi:MAG: hypothetical protein PVG93_00120 [Phycisphaerales bacterium]|jgi:tetratricopeptide (TPR) repeat protein